MYLRFLMLFFILYFNLKTEYSTIYVIRLQKSIEISEFVCKMHLIVHGIIMWICFHSVFSVRILSVTYITKKILNLLPLTESTETKLIHKTIYKNTFNSDIKRGRKSRDIYSIPVDRISTKVNISVF